MPQKIEPCVPTEKIGKERINIANVKETPAFRQIRIGNCASSSDSGPNTMPTVTREGNDLIIRIPK